MGLISVNLEWLFTEAGPRTADRIRAAAAAGFTAVEIWGWRDKDLAAIEAALRETGVRLLTLIVDPACDLADRSSHERYLEGVRDSLAVAERLGSPFLVALAGQEIGGVPPAVQRAAVVDALKAASGVLERAGTEVTLLLEPLNTRVDHPGALVHSTRNGLDIVDAVGSPRLRLLLDVYHALMMGEDLAAEVGSDGALIGHVQVADLPGRNEPGTGEVDWDAVLRTVRGLGYSGPFGMEYVPTTGSAVSLDHIRDVVDRLR
jgi:hydroxypyruvate isomerase